MHLATLQTGVVGERLTGDRLAWGICPTADAGLTCNERLIGWPLPHSCHGGVYERRPQSRALPITGAVSPRSGFPRMAVDAAGPGCRSSADSRGSRYERRRERNRAVAELDGLACLLC